MATGDQRATRAVRSILITASRKIRFATAMRQEADRRAPMMKTRPRRTLAVSVGLLRLGIVPDTDFLLRRREVIDRLERQEPFVHLRDLVIVLDPKIEQLFEIEKRNLSPFLGSGFRLSFGCEAAR